MRTTLDIPGNLIEEAQRLLGFKSKTDTIVPSLRELIRRHRIGELKALMGNVRLDIDLHASRRRPQRGDPGPDRPPDRSRRRYRRTLRYLLIAAIAVEQGASPWSPDDDFVCMAGLRLVTLHRANCSEIKV